MKFGIFARSTAGYLIILLLLGASNVYAIFKLVQFNTIIVQSLEVDISALDLEKRLVDSIFSQQRYEQKYLLTKDGAFYSQFLAARDEFNKYLSEFSAVPASPAIRETVEKVKSQYQHYLTLVDREVGYLRENRAYDRQGYRLAKEQAADVIHEELERLEDYSHADIHAITKKVGEAGAAARKVAMASFVGTVLFAILLSFFITRGITRPLLRLVSKTREIPTGSFNCDVGVSAPPEIGELAEAFNTMCERLQAVDKIKADFFSMISHELRTPLTTIKEGTNLLLEGAGGAPTEKQGRLLTIIASESGRLTGLVNSILDLSKMEAGMMMYNFEVGSMAPLLERALEEITPYAEAKKIHLEKQIAPDLAPCRMDGERILEVLRNLVGNAVKFTPDSGRVAVSAKPVPGGIEVAVSDTGPGIPKERLTAVFEKFESIDPRKGTGLGLALVKHIIAAHGGKVWAESEPGAGSKFIFVLPS